MNTEEKKKLMEEQKEQLDAPEEKPMVEHKETVLLKEHEEEKLLGEGANNSNLISDMETRLKRLAADFENFKKRAYREHDALKETACAGFVEEMIPVLDEFELALMHMQKSNDRDGVEMIYKRLFEVVKRQGLQEMNAVGEKFDPELHEAVESAVNTSENEGKIIKVLQKGYLFKGKVLRHAKVSVGRKKNYDEV